MPAWESGRRPSAATRARGPAAYGHRAGAPGVLAQSEACVLSKHEVLGSKPRYSSGIVLFFLFVPVVHVVSVASSLRPGRGKLRRYSIGAVPRLVAPVAPVRFRVVAARSRLAQLVERKTLNLVVVGSSPTVGDFFCR